MYICVYFENWSVFNNLYVPDIVPDKEGYRFVGKSLEYVAIWFKESCI